MLRTKLAKEVTVRTENKIGALDDIAKAVAEKGIDLLAACGWVEGSQAVIRLVTDDSVRVLDTLRARKYDVREADVLVTQAPHKAGMLHRLTEKLAHGNIDIHHLYATATAGQEQSLIVCGTSNNDRAMVLLNATAGTT